jgi:hypothetical protein
MWLSGNQNDANAPKRTFAPWLRMPTTFLADLPFLRIRRSEPALHSCSVMPAAAPPEERETVLSFQRERQVVEDEQILRRNCAKSSEAILSAVGDQI